LRTMLKEILSQLLGGMVAYPGLSKAQLYYPFMLNDYSLDFIPRFDILLSDIVQKYCAKLPPKKIRLFKRSVIYIVSSAMFVGAFPRFFDGFEKLEIENPPNLNEFLDYLIDIHLKKIGL
jgi:hypothetical protein